MTRSYDQSQPPRDAASPPLPLAPGRYAAAPGDDPISPPTVWQAPPPLPMTPSRYGVSASSLGELQPLPPSVAERLPLRSPPLPMAARDYPPAPPHINPPYQNARAAAVTDAITAPSPAPPVASSTARDAAPFLAEPQKPAPPIQAAITGEAATPQISEPGGWLDFARRVATIAAYVFAGWLALILFLIVVFRVVDPPLSSLMAQQRLAGQEVTQDWIDISDVSPDVIRAVLLSEDGRFCQHAGIDFEEMQNAIDRARDGAPRGASTISMQVVKNMFLWPSRSYVRKAIEIPLTYAMEAVWPKSRIMEVYLNIAEWGPGVFGVEAAARHHFNKSASRLGEREAARLAVALPNPFLRDAGDPGPQTRRLAADIQARMRAAPASQTACVIDANARRAAPRRQPKPANDDDWEPEIRRFP